MLNYFAEHSTMKRINSILIGATLIAIFSCNKDNNPPPIPPVVEKDSMLGNWEKINSQLAGILDISFLNSKVGFLIGPDGIYTSKDSGKTWAASATGKGYFNNLFFLNSTVGYAQGRSDFAYTIDGGISWIRKNIDLHTPKYLWNC